jgi:hypothetical protein
MDSEFVSTCKRTLEIQGFGRPAEHVPSAMASRSAKAYHLKRWLQRCQEKQTREKEKIMKYIITIQVADAAAVARAMMAEEDAEVAEDAEEDAAEEETTIVSI